MITFEPKLDLELIKKHFVTAEDYDTDTILDELRTWQGQDNFFCLVSRGGVGIDGFLVAYPNRDSLWLSQSWHNGDVSVAKEGWAIMKDWAVSKGFTSITGETQRNEKSAMERLGFSEFSVIMKCNLRTEVC